MVGINFTGEGYQIYNELSLGSLRSKIVEKRTSQQMVEMYNKSSKDLLEIIDHALILLAD